MKVVLKILLWPLWWLLAKLFLRPLVDITSPAEDDCKTCNPPGTVSFTITFATPLPTLDCHAVLYFQDAGGALTAGPGPVTSTVPIGGASMNISFPFDCTTLPSGPAGCKDLVIMIIRVGPGTKKRIIGVQTVKLCKTCPP